jgi:hypothetical protein
MNIRYVTDRASALVIAMGLAAACREEVRPAPLPAPKPAPPVESVAVDAGEAGVSHATSAPEQGSPNSSASDAGPDAASTEPTRQKPDAASDAGPKKRHAVDAGDAGDGGVTDAGHAREVHECSSLDSEGPNEVGLCADKHEDWCESDGVVANCEDQAASRDEGVFAAYLDCLDEAFDDPDLCDGDDSVRLEAAAACIRSADEVACVEHTPACDIYDGCEEYTVAQCDANVAKFNDQYLRYGTPYFECPTPPSVALGE